MDEELKKLQNEIDALKLALSIKEFEYAVLKALIEIATESEQQTGKEKKNNGKSK